MTGNEARALRRGLRMSARQLALEIGTTDSTIYRWEWRGNREVPRMYALALREVVRRHSQQDDDNDDSNGAPQAASQ